MPTKVGKNYRNRNNLAHGSMFIQGSRRAKRPHSEKGKRRKPCGKHVDQRCVVCLRALCTLSKQKEYAEPLASEGPDSGETAREWDQFPGERRQNWSLLPCEDI